MNEKGDDQLLKLHREAVERHWPQQERLRAQVEAMFDQAVERQREQEERDQALIEHPAGEGGVVMSGQAEDLVVRLHREEVERMRLSPQAPCTPPERPAIHYTQLPDAPPDSPIVGEWNLYRRIVGRLLAEGHEGKWLLIKDEEIVGIWATEAEANAVRLDRFLTQPVLMKQILATEPILHIGYNRLCRS